MIAPVRRTTTRGHARSMTASKLARTISGFRAVDGSRLGQDAVREARWQVLEDGMIEIRAVLPAEVGAELVTALELAMDRDGRDPATVERGAPAGVDPAGALLPESVRTGNAPPATRSRSMRRSGRPVRRPRSPPPRPSSSARQMPWCPWPAPRPIHTVPAPVPGPRPLRSLRHRAVARHDRAPLPARGTPDPPRAEPRPAPPPPSVADAPGTEEPVTTRSTRADADPQRIAATTGWAGFRRADCVDVPCRSILQPAA